MEFHNLGRGEFDTYNYNSKNLYNPEMWSKSEKNGFWVSVLSPKNLCDPPLG